MLGGQQPLQPRDDLLRRYPVCLGIVAAELQWFFMSDT